MKQNILRKICIALMLLIFPNTSFARDFVVQFLEENYKQIHQEYSNSPEIYHSIQVNTDVAGPKLLILSGDNPAYRTWLRQYISSGKSFIVKIPDSETNLFIASKVFEIDVTAVHPFNNEKWEMPLGIEKVGFLKHNNSVLIVDANEKRSNLINIVIQHIGLSASVFSRPDQALLSFQQQPDKYELIILDHDMQGIAVEDFINTVTGIDRQIPIIIGAGYKNTSVAETFSKKFLTTTSVIVVPVVLKDLNNRIQQLLKQENA